MFTDRHEAGRLLAHALLPLAPARPLVLALPRGGVPLAREVANSLNTDLDVLIVRKLGVPSNPEFAFGAVGEGGGIVLDHDTITALGISSDEQQQAITRAQREIDHRVATYRHGLPITDVTGRTVIIVDDGLATGATAAAAVAVARHIGAQRVILAVPTGSRQAVHRLQQLSDEVVCLEIPPNFGSVGAQYESFPQVSDNKVLSNLGSAR